MERVIDFEPLKTLHVLIYGAIGMGKTLFACGFPAPIWVIDCDKGMLSIKTTDLISEDKKKEIYFETILEKYFNKGSKQRVQPTAYNRVRAMIELISSNGEIEGIRPKTVVLDSMTTFGEYALDDSMAAAKHLGNAKVSQPDWGGQIRRMNETIGLGRSMTNLNFICTAHEGVNKNKEGAVIAIFPLVTGRFATRIGLYFDEVYRASTKAGPGGKREYCLKTQPTPLASAKSRLNLPNDIEASYTTIQEFLKKKGL